MDRMEKAQMDTIGALSNLFKVGGHVEKVQVCKAVDALHDEVFSVSYEGVYTRSEALREKCKALSASR